MTRHRFSIAAVVVCTTIGCTSVGPVRTTKTVPDAGAVAGGAPRSKPPRSAAPQAATPAPLTLRFIDDFNWHGAAPTPGPPFGGLSGMCMGADGELLAVSDGRRAEGPTRFYRLKLTLDEHQVGFEIASVVRLDGASASADPEGLALAPGGGLLMSLEGDGKVDPRVEPAILRLELDGRVTGRLPIPDKFAPTPRGPLERGVRVNRGFEGLSHSPDGEAVFAATEQALAQDGPEPSFRNGTRIRLLHYDAQLRLVAEYAYLTDAMPSPDAPAKDISHADLGVSEILALDARTLLVLERAAVAVRGQFRNRLRLYQVSLDGARDVSQLNALDDDSPLLSKQLVLDLDSIVPQLDPAFRRLDNFEGLALGPRLPSGEPTLLMVSDDNFSKVQRTVLLAFAIGRQP
jgi:hypothetical protein